jgi:tryptophanyl-tRNA synthetase
VVTDFVTPVRARTQELLDDPSELERVLAEGAARAREVAAPTLRAAYDRAGFLAPAGVATPAGTAAPAEVAAQGVSGA